MSDKGKFYMTTAIAYTSGKPHIGNTYEIVLADAIARYKRLEGYDVYFQTGTDEHGQKIQEKAEKAGITPKEYVDNVAGEVKRIWDLITRPTITLSARLTQTMKNRCRRSLKSCTIRETSTRDLTRDFTVRRVSPSGQSPSWWTASARTAGER